MRLSALAFALYVSATLAAPTNNAGEARPFAHELKPGDIAEECLRLEAGKSRRFEWTANAPVDFNVHYHAGEKVTYPVKVNARRKGAGKFTAATGEDYCWMWTATSPATVTGRLGPEE